MYFQVNLPRKRNNFKVGKKYPNAFNSFKVYALVYIEKHHVFSLF